MKTRKGKWDDWWYVHVDRTRGGDGYMFWTKDQWIEFIKQLKDEGVELENDEGGPSE